MSAPAKRREGEGHTSSFERWTVLWTATPKRDPSRHFILFEDSKFQLFQTRSEARAWAEKHYGYIKTRKDLRVEPHCWRMPQAVKVRVTVTEVKQ